MSADFRRIIDDRRFGRAHSKADLRLLATGAAMGSIPDYQLTAWLMAAMFKPLTVNETAELTLAMAESGEQLDLSSIAEPKLDKHSTGGVGDKTSLALLPILAACGVSVVKMSGAGLGITGGTVDKLASIPGLRVQLTPDELVAQAKKVRIAITGQSADLAPADKVLYGLRDATDTVDSIPLIVSSILSKKLAGGAKTVLIDVKCGSGAFMKSLGQAKELAQSLREVGTRCGLTISTEITDMSQPLGAAVGNALEVREALEVLSGPARFSSSQRFLDLCLKLGSEALVVCGLSEDRQKGLELCQDAVGEGRAALAAQAWLNAQGAPGKLWEIIASLPRAQLLIQVKAQTDGWIEKIDAGTVGRVVIGLGGGRLSKSDTIDPSVGVFLTKPVGAQVRKGDLLAVIHAAAQDDAGKAKHALKDAIVLALEPAPSIPLMLA